MKTKTWFALGLTALLLGACSNPPPRADIIGDSVLTVPMSSVKDVETLSFNRRPMVTFVFDDGSDDDYQRMLPMFRNRPVPVPGVSAVIRNKINVTNYMKRSEIQALIDAGWEIASHSLTHPKLTTITRDQKIKEIKWSQAQLKDMGITTTSFVYPTGDNDEIVRSVTASFYRAGLAVGQGINDEVPSDLFNIRRISLGSWTPTYKNTLEWYKSCVDSAIANNTWLIFVVHPYAAEHTATQDQYLMQTIDYIQEKGVAVVTVSQALDYMGVGPGL